MGKQSRRECDKKDCPYYNLGYHNHFSGRIPIYEYVRKILHEKGELATPTLYEKLKKIPGANRQLDTNSLNNELGKDAYIGEVRKIKVKGNRKYGSHEVTVWKHRFAGIEAIVA